MPQLDKLTYTTQIFWLVVLFTTFYFFILKHILPKILLNLKVRNTKINSISLGSENSINEALEVNANFVRANDKVVGLLTNFLENSKDLINNSWNYSNLSVTNSKHMLDSNELHEDLIISHKLNSAIKGNE